MLAFIIGLDCSKIGVDKVLNKKQLYKVNRVNLYDLESGDKFDLSLYETIKLKDKIIGTKRLEMIESNYSHDYIWDSVYLSSDFERFVVLVDNKEPELCGVYANLKVTVDGVDSYIGNGIVGASAFRDGVTPKLLDAIYDTKNDMFDLYFNSYSAITKKRRHFLLSYGIDDRLVDYIIDYHDYSATPYYYYSLNGCLEYRNSSKSNKSLIVPDGFWYVKLPFDLKNSSIQDILFNRSVRIIEFKNTYTDVVDNVTFHLHNKTNINIIKRLILDCLNDYITKHTDYSSDSDKERAKKILELCETVRVNNNKDKINSDKEYLISEAYKAGVKIKLY